MDLRKIADNLGISNYPADLEQATPMDVCDLNLIEHIHKEYNIFREHYEDVINGAKALKNDPDRYIWAQYACGYMLDLSLAAAKKFPLPVDEGVGDILPLLIHLPMIPICVEVYRARGFSDETIKEMMASYYDFAKSIFHKTGTFGLDLRFHRWMLTYAKSLIFPYMGFNIEVLTFPEGALVLKNKENAKVLPLIYNEAIHQSGNILGASWGRGRRTMLGDPKSSGRNLGPPHFSPGSPAPRVTISRAGLHFLSDGHSHLRTSPDKGTENTGKLQVCPQLLAKQY